MGNAFYPLTPTQVPEPDTWDGSQDFNWEDNTADQTLFQGANSGNYEFELTGELTKVSGGSSTPWIDLLGGSLYPTTSRTPQTTILTGLPAGAVSWNFKSPIHLIQGQRNITLRMRDQGNTISGTLTLRYRRSAL